MSSVFVWLFVFRLLFTNIFAFPARIIIWVHQCWSDFSLLLFFSFKDSFCALIFCLHSLRLDRKRGRQGGSNTKKRVTGWNWPAGHCSGDTAPAHGTPAPPTEPPWHPTGLISNMHRPDSQIKYLRLDFCPCDLPFLLLLRVQTCGENTLLCKQTSQTLPQVMDVCQQQQPHYLFSSSSLCLMVT